MTPMKLPYDQFLKSFELAPRVAIDLWIKNEDGAVVYTKREVEPYKGLWHLPGSFILVGESVEECVKRLVDEELGLKINDSNFKLRNLDEDLHELRGHVIHLVYEVKIVKAEIMETENVRWLFEPPKDIIPTHRRIFLNLN